MQSSWKATQVKYIFYSPFTIVSILAIPGATITDAISTPGPSHRNTEGSSRGKNTDQPQTCKDFL